MKNSKLKTLSLAVLLASPSLTYAFTAFNINNDLSQADWDNIAQGNAVTVNDIAGITGLDLTLQQVGGTTTNLARAGTGYTGTITQAAPTNVTFSFNQAVNFRLNSAGIRNNATEEITFSSTNGVAQINVVDTGGPGTLDITSGAQDTNSLTVSFIDATNGSNNLTATLSSLTNFTILNTQLPSDPAGSRTTQFNTFEVELSTIPEPADYAMILGAISLVGLGVRRRFAAKKA